MWRKITSLEDGERLIYQDREKEELFKFTLCFNGDDNYIFTPKFFKILMNKYRFGAIFGGYGRLTIQRLNGLCELPKNRLFKIDLFGRGLGLNLRKCVELNISLLVVFHENMWKFHLLKNGRLISIYDRNQ